MHKYNIVLGIFFLSSLCMTHGFKSTSGQYRRPNFKKIHKRQTSTDFDVLIFTEAWPATACFVWKEHDKSHSCLLPKYEEWTIHGIWPTKYNTTGPEYCNTSLPFNSSALAPIENELKESWIDIQNGSKPYSFWKHEWDKHGTCAGEIETLNNEFSYFKKGLELLKSYNMSDILAKQNILLGKKYYIDEMLTAIENVLGKTSLIRCAKHEETDEFYVNEIRICFDKSLQLINCDGIYGFPTNCDRSKQIIYPSYDTPFPDYYVPHYSVQQI